MKKAEAAAITKAAITKGQPPVAKKASSPPVTQIISLFRKNFPLWATKPSGDRNMKLAESTSPIKYAGMLMCSSKDGYCLNPYENWELKFYYNKIRIESTESVTVTHNVAYWHVDFLYNFRNITVTAMDTFDYGEIEICFKKFGNEDITDLKDNENIMDTAYGQFLHSVINTLLELQSFLSLNFDKKYTRFNYYDHKAIHGCPVSYILKLGFVKDKRSRWYHYNIANVNFKKIK